VVRDLLNTHYDPTYTQSMQRNFAQFAQARMLEPQDHTMVAMERVAVSLLTA
jgi:tRNA 2-selenouridine synthase